jgi:hypothetical protein
MATLSKSMEAAMMIMREPAYMADGAKITLQLMKLIYGTPWVTPKQTEAVAILHGRQLFERLSMHQIVKRPSGPAPDPDCESFTNATNHQGGTTSYD